MLIGIGLIAVAAASPAAGQRYSGGNVRFNELHYFYRQIGLDRRVAAGDDRHFDAAARAAAALCRSPARVCSSALLALVPFIGEEKNGAVRWINIGVGQLQPSEFLKPFFVVAMAWLLSLQAGRQEPAGLPACRRC